MKAPSPLWLYGPPDRQPCMAVVTSTVLRSASFLLLHWQVLVIVVMEVWSRMKSNATVKKWHKNEICAVTPPDTSYCHYLSSDWEKKTCCTECAIVEASGLRLMRKQQQGCCWGSGGFTGISWYSLLKKDLIVTDHRATSQAWSSGENHLTGNKLKRVFADGAIPNRFS